MPEKMLEKAADEFEKTVELLYPLMIPKNMRDSLKAMFKEIVKKYSAKDFNGDGWDGAC